MFERVLIEEAGYTVATSQNFPIHDTEPVRIRSPISGGYLDVKREQSIMDREHGADFVEDGFTRYLVRSVL